MPEEAAIERLLAEREAQGFARLCSDLGVLDLIAAVLREPEESSLAPVS